MRFRLPLFVCGLALAVAGCNFTLAEDVTPPPDYVPPTPMPTLGPLYPSVAPDVQTGAVIFAEKCSPCHGASGMGDGPQSMQLPVTVPGIGLAEVARKAVPADWFKVVTQGNLDRFMPPFAGSLSDAERWAVVGYVLTLHSSGELVARGQALVDADCPSCRQVFSDLERMAGLSDDALARIIREGDSEVPAFAANYSDQDAYAAVAYARSLSLHVGSEAASATAVTPSTPAAGTETAPVTESATGVGQVSGSIESSTGSQVGALTVTLHGFDHAADQTSGPQEVLTISTATAPDGSYRFDDVEMPPNRIFLSDVVYAGITYRSGFQAAGADSRSIALPALKLYEPSTDASLLTLDQVHIYTDFATPGTVQVLEIFAFSNSSDRSVIISTDGTSIPFIQLPAQAVNQGYEAGQGSETFVTADQGLAVVPSDKPYSIIAFFNLAFEKSLDFTQRMAIDTPSVLLLVPDGIKADGAQLAAEGPQVIQNNNYQEYSAADLTSGQSLSFKLSGRPRQSPATGPDVQQRWLIGGGALGLTLIVVGLLLYVRERRLRTTEVLAPEFETTDEVLDAILALDDLHRAGKIPDDAYQRRRLELKEMLRELS